MAHIGAENWNELIDDWARKTLIWGKPAPLADYVEWLKAGDPDRWHYAASNWNWDYGFAPLWWIVTRNECDAATALLIFHLTEQSYAWPEDSEEHLLLQFIRNRWMSGGYDRSEIAYDYPYKNEETPDELSLQAVPAPMRVSLEGRRISSEQYNNNLPEFFFW